jgi:ribosomal protein S6
MNRPYEGIIFMKPTLSEAEIATVITKIKNIAADLKGAITEEKAPEKKKLPYAMHKCKEGFYYFFRFNMESTSIAEMKSRVKIIEDIIRVTVSTAVPQKAPAPAEPKVEKPAAEEAKPAEPVNTEGEAK